MMNQALYDKLRDIFGEVSVTNEGQAFVFTQAPDVSGKMTLKKQQSGEEYRVCCPICGDTRFRLYINHAYGQDAAIGFPTSKLIKCQNDGCERNERASENASEVVRRRLGGYLRDVLLGIAPKVRTQTVDARRIPVLEYPKELTTVDKLSVGHPAYDYLVERNFSPEEIGSEYKVGYTEAYTGTRNGSDYSWLSGRLFIPCGDGGWQARDLQGFSRMKYFTSPGWQKSKTIYNIENAMRTPNICVLCEGVTDVWRVGPRGVAIFGKDLSDAQCTILSRNFAAVAVALDSDAFEGGGKTSGVKAIVNLQKRGVNAFRVLLPPNSDPADCTRDEVWKLVQEETIKRGLSL